MAIKEQLSFDVTPEQKRRLHSLHDKTRIPRAELVRLALGLLFQAYDAGDLPRLIAGGPLSGSSSPPPLMLERESDARQRPELPDGVHVDTDTVAPKDNKRIAGRVATRKGKK